MGFNPLKEKGTPLERQFRNWSEMNLKPYNKSEIHPHTRTRIILMNSIETEGVLFSHSLLRHLDNPEVREKVTLLRRIEQQQQKMINWLIPAQESVLELTLGYEQALVDLTAWLARTEPDPYVKAALNFALLENVDHLYRFANLYDLTVQADAEKIVGDLTEIFPGKPTADQHQHPLDTMRRSKNAALSSNSNDLLTTLHLLTALSSEQQAMIYYMNVGNRSESMLGRGLYQEINMVKEQHVTLYGTLQDPNLSWLEMLLIHEYNECYMYYSCMESENDSHTRILWQQLLENEIEHLRTVATLMEMSEGRAAESLLPQHFPKLSIFDSNKEYIRALLCEQIETTASGDQYLQLSKLSADSDYFTFQNLVNGQGCIPSLQIIGESIRRNGFDFRIEHRGEHPVEWMRDRSSVQRTVRNQT